MKKALLTLFAAAVCLSSAAQMKISGTVKDSAEKPVAGVVVSDGFSCANTDAKGRYRLAASKDAFYVFYSIPAEYGIATKDGHPDFYKKIEKGVKKYDFTLAPLEGGVEKEFKLVMVADPQAQCDFHVKRFERETVPDIRAYVDAQSVPCYGVTLGDMAYSEGKANAVPLMPEDAPCDGLRPLAPALFPDYGQPRQRIRSGCDRRAQQQHQPCLPASVRGGVRTCQLLVEPRRRAYRVDEGHRVSARRKEQQIPSGVQPRAVRMAVSRPVASAGRQDGDSVRAYRTVRPHEPLSRRDPPTAQTVQGGSYHGGTHPLHEP